MNHRSHSSRRPSAVPVALVWLLLMACAAHAQPTAGESTPPRTSDGRPDLQGVGGVGFLHHHDHADEAS